jgi:arginine utilization protein RocB
MPHIPTPPPMTLSQKIQTIQRINTTPTQSNGVLNIAQPNSNVAQQIKDVAEQQARMVLDEWMKQYKDLFESKESKLKINNIRKIIGMEYDSRLRVIGVLEENKYYEFTLGNDLLNQTENILLHRRQTDSGHYIMEYKGKTLWLTKDEIDMPEKIIICMNTI